ncbi:MAG: CDP-alcohol phosphatidyltransferase family protein [Candidatus Hydrogenedentota bacterium]
MSYGRRKDQLRKTFQPRKEWWSRVFATPMAYLLLLVVADWRFLTPNRLTILSFTLTIVSGLLILSDTTASLVGAGIVLQVAYVIDCMDGQLARYRGLSSKVGSLLDKCSDFVAFPFIIVALSLQASNHLAYEIPTILGFATIFLICYQPYLKLIAAKECSIGPWNRLSGQGFYQRNLRFFLFEEAQWYLIVTLCLFLNSAIAALLILTVTQGIIALFQTARVFWLATHPDDQNTSN